MPFAEIVQISVSERVVFLRFMLNSTQKPIQGLRLRIFAASCVSNSFYSESSGRIFSQHRPKEINRVILECDPIGNGIDIQLIEHISPITWDNVILYGEYVIDEKLVRV